MSEPQPTPKPRPIPRFAYASPSGTGRTYDEIAHYGMDSVAELGRLFQIVAALVDPASAAYQLAQSGIAVASERRAAIDAARMSEKLFREKDRK
ncbi:hypothetical protein [Andreprevotia chitinilytica]|uniref:hypothetical protein n=1 Tax=Andreprevotia chitinilytica TaxID=396808 RepID=UPI00055654B8|nr:hypothetical protein [Andreprevotia chitinilytica]